MQIYFSASEHIGIGKSFVSLYDDMTQFCDTV